jgi:hypothetical protein
MLHGEHCCGPYCSALCCVTVQCSAVQCSSGERLLLYDTCETWICKEVLSTFQCKLHDIGVPTNQTIHSLVNRDCQQEIKRQMLTAYWEARWRRTKRLRYWGYAHEGHHNVWGLCSITQR